MSSSVDSRPIPRRIVILLAVTVGVVVANLYYVQPLLNSVALALGTSPAAAGLLVTASQSGYVVGLVLLVPLGDMLERRRLICVLLIAASLVAGICATAESLSMLATGLAVLGLFSAVGSILVPLSASLAGPGDAGKVVGTVMSGLLLGIVLARTVSGLLAQAGGFRLAFAVAAVAMAVLAGVLRWMLPVSPPPTRQPYRRMLGSVLVLVRTEPILRQRMALGFLQMAGFTVLWTSLAPMLGGAPYHYDDLVIGLFGLAGGAGAIITPVAGRWADRGQGTRALTVFLVALLASWALLATGQHTLAALILGIVVLDFAVNGAQVSNQAAIYALRPEARSRMTTASSVSFFSGGAVGSLLAAVVYRTGGWPAACLLGAGLATLALAVWIATRRRIGSPCDPIDEAQQSTERN